MVRLTTIRRVAKVGLGMFFWGDLDLRTLQVCDAFRPGLARERLPWFTAPKFFSAPTLSGLDYSREFIHRVGWY